MSPTVRRRVVLLPRLLTVLLLPGGSKAQEEVVPLIQGEVRVGDTLLPGVTVVLHQVSADSSGEIDSVRTALDGTFQIRLPHVPDHATRQEVFFASTEYKGLLYFGPAITEAVQLDSLYLIQAYDTLSVPPGGAELPLTARNLFLEKAEEGWTATDVFEIRQDGTRTLYSPEDGVVWSYPLPQGAQDFQVGQSDLAPEAVRFTRGRLELYAPLPPGERYLMVRYGIPDTDFVLPLPGRTDRLEVLVREPAVELDPGNVFRRYSADGLVDTEARAQAAPEPWRFPAQWAALFLTGLLGAAGVVGFRRKTGAAGGAALPSGGARSRDELLLAVASLDQAFEAEVEPSEEAVARYRARRAALLEKLKSSG